MTRYKKGLNVADPEGQWPNTILEYQFVKGLDGVSADRTYLHAKSTVKINKYRVPPDMPSYVRAATFSNHARHHTSPIRTETLQISRYLKRPRELH